MHAPSSVESSSTTGAASASSSASSFKTKSVGEKNPIELPVIAFSDFVETLGGEIAHGSFGTIYEVKESRPARVYKIIPTDKFENGDEIRISKIASNIGIAPQFHRAFFTAQRQRSYVVIEMDHAGKTLGHLLEDLAEELEPKPKELSPEERAEEARQKALQEMFAQLEKEHGSSFIVTEIPTKKRLDLKEAIANPKMYAKPEDFYFELFSKFKLFAEHNIAYGDSHVGNIIPNIGNGKGMQFIDFDSAKLMPNPKEAIKASMTAYNLLHLKNYSELPTLSEKSKNLLVWFMGA